MSIELEIFGIKIQDGQQQKLKEQYSKIDFDQTFSITEDKHIVYFASYLNSKMYQLMTEQTLEVNGLFWVPHKTTIDNEHFDITILTHLNKMKVKCQKGIPRGKYSKPSGQNKPDEIQ